jgi:hypothetical protein
MQLDIHELIEKNIAAGAEIEVAGPVSPEKIHQAERMLGVEFPPSYKAYMAEYGALEIDGRTFAGLTPRDVGSAGDVVAFTKHAREKYGLPEQYVALDFQDGDAFLSIDTAQRDADDESPMVLISPVNGKQQGPFAAKSLKEFLVKYLSA